MKHLCFGSLKSIPPGNRAWTSWPAYWLTIWSHSGSGGSDSGGRSGNGRTTPGDVPTSQWVSIGHSPSHAGKVSSHNTGGVSQKHGPPAGSMVQTSPAIGHEAVAGRRIAQIAGHRRPSRRSTGRPPGRWCRRRPAIGHGPSQVAGSLRSQSTTSGMHSQISGWIRAELHAPRTVRLGLECTTVDRKLRTNTSKKLSI